MRYLRAADAWCDALPLGNGRLGAMVYGHTRVDRIQLNEDSLWYGKAMDRNNPLLKDALPEIRRCVFEGQAAGGRGSHSALHDWRTLFHAPL